MTPNIISHATNLLRAGQLVSFPTETVYGLGADASNDAAVAAIYAAKGRPSFNPLIIHAPSVDDLKNVAQFSQTALRLAGAFWPGPLTMVLPRAADCRISRLASAGLPTVAVRIPAHPLALELLRAVQRPIAAPSANPSGFLSPTCAVHVRNAFSPQIVPLVIDGGACSVGLESTIVDCTNDPVKILRAGSIIADDIARITGYQVANIDAAAVAGLGSSALIAPGQMRAHYAPRIPLRLNALTLDDDEALLAFGDDRSIAGGHTRLNLSLRGDVNEAAANLFAFLHELESCGARSIAAMTIPQSGLGIAINDRLNRAAYAYV